MSSSCPSSAELTELINGTLAPAESAALEAHLGQCSGCRQRLSGLAGGGESWLATKAGLTAEPAWPASLCSAMARLKEPDKAVVSEKPGDRIGRYKLLQQIGEGGGGVVYAAEQEEPVRRRVALKIIKLGMDTQSVIARFEAERQALALMDHPSIARVLDAGATETGRPYFVMELVRGLKITEYCDQTRLTTKARLGLFIQVCNAIQHAHQKGIIHRDIKPSNVLVTMNDGVAVPKVIDFGIAKATSGQKLTDKTIFTAFEQFIGTPAYMSPEQAVLTSLDIDTRSDVYALGVLLYELLTGGTPFDGKALLAVGLDEMRRTIRDQEPPKPSTRVSTLPGDQQGTTAHRRGLEAPNLASELRGDLDWIVMKAMEKDRGRRYETANALAMDVQRHLDSEPVVARPPSRLYRFQKALQRNKLAFAAGAAVAASMVVGLAISTVLFLREHSARMQAAEQTAVARAVNEFLREDLLQQASSSFQAAAGFTPDPNLTVRQALERAAGRIEDRFKNQPMEEAAVKHAVGNTFLGLGLPLRAIPHLQRAFELRRARLGADQPETLASMGRLAWAHIVVSNLDLALPLQEELVRRQRARRPPDYAALVNSLINLAVAYITAGRLDQGIRLEEETLELARSTIGPMHQETLVLMANLSQAYRDSGRPYLALSLAEQALERMRVSLGTNNPFTQKTMAGLAFGHRLAGNLDRALPLLEEALKLRQATLGEDHSDALNLEASLAETYLAAGRLNDAQPLLRDLTARGNAQIWNSLAWWLATGLDARQRDGVTALVLAEKAAEATQRRDPVILDTLAAAYAEAGRFESAVAAQEQAIALLREEWMREGFVARLKLYESKRPFREGRDPGGHLAAVAQQLLTAGKFYEAELPARQCLALREKFIPNDWRTFNAQCLLGGCLLGQRKYAEAEPLLISGYEGLRRCESEIPDAGKPRIAEALQRIVQLYEATGRAAQATEWKRGFAGSNGRPTLKTDASRSSRE